MSKSTSGILTEVKNATGDHTEPYLIYVTQIHETLSSGFTLTEGAR